MTKRFIDYIVVDYELPIPLFKRSNKTIFSPRVNKTMDNRKLMSAQLESAYPREARSFVSGLSSKYNAIATLIV